MEPDGMMRFYANIYGYDRLQLAVYKNYNKKGN